MKIIYFLLISTINAFLIVPSQFRHKIPAIKLFAEDEYVYIDPDENFNKTQDLPYQPLGIRVIIKNNQDSPSNNNDDLNNNTDNYINNHQNPFTKGIGLEDLFGRRMGNTKGKKKTENFEIETEVNTNFNDIGGYTKIKEELNQCSDLLINFNKYKDFNVRTPKGLILEGPPGNGKTLLARAFSGETNSSFIAVSGSEFQEKYVGVGSSRIRELFNLADENKPCIIFIDEIDAIGRKRGGEFDQANAERDNTLNQLLVKLDGYKNSNGIFLICATNRIDLLDPALLRPGRIDKKIFVDNPDQKTREEIIKIHIQGKPYESNIDIKHLVDITAGMSGAEVENLLNEAMLNALRENRNKITLNDLEIIQSKNMVGWKSSENIFSNDMLKKIAVHELGHAITGLLSKDHSKLSRVHLNSWSPSNPGYTIFETDEIDSNIFTKKRLLSHLVVLLGGRKAEELFFGESITTGASKDFEQAYNLAESMILKYGMGSNNIFPSYSDKSKQIVDNEIFELLQEADKQATNVLTKCHGLIDELSDLLIKTKKLERSTIEMRIYRKCPELFQNEF